VYISPRNWYTGHTERPQYCVAVIKSNILMAAIVPHSTNIHSSQTSHLSVRPTINPTVQHGSHAVFCVGLQPLFCWDSGFESCRAKWTSASSQCCVLSGRVFCDGPITWPGESHRSFVCVLLNVIRCNNKLLHLHWISRRDQNKIQWNWPPRD